MRYLVLKREDFELHTNMWCPLHMCSIKFRIESERSSESSFSFLSGHLRIVSFVGKIYGRLGHTFNVITFRSLGKTSSLR